MNTFSLKEAALNYAKQGKKVFPLWGITNGQCDCGKSRCVAGKHPILSGGFKDASSDLKTVAKFWDKNPNANIGLVVGKEAGLLVLDIDPRNGGSQSYENLVNTMPLPETYTVETSRGGRHFYFAYPKKDLDAIRWPANSFQGIDLKHNGYVVAPPSMHQTGERYKVIENNEVVELPQDVIELISLPQRDSSFAASKDDPETEEKILSALEYISPIQCDYDTWLNVGMAIYSWDPSRLDLWDEWSRVDVVRYKSAEMQIKWNSFGKNTRESSITLGTLFNLAKRRGWVFDENQKKYSMAQRCFPIVDFPFDIFPSQLQRLFFLIGKQIQVAPEPGACMALAIIGAAWGNSVRLQVQNQQFISPFIWFILIAKTGYGKTPIEEILTREIKSRESGLFTSYVDELKTYNSLDEKEKKKAPRPTYKTCISSDFTIEGLAKLFLSNPRGILIVKDEVMGVLNGLNQYKGKGGNDREKFLELFNAQSWKRDRVSEPVFIPQTGASIIGGAQPFAIKELFSEKGILDGMLPRFLFYVAKDMSKKYSKESFISSSDLEAWNQLVLSAYKVELYEKYDGNVEHQVIKLSDEALDYYLERLNSVESVRNLLEPSIQACIPKQMTYFSKFCLILHCMDCLVKSKKVNHQPVSKATVMNAYRLVQFFMGQMVDSFVSNGEPDKSYSDETRMIRILKTLFSELKTDRITLESIRQKYNEELPPEFNLNANQSQRISKILRGLGLSTTRGSKGYYYVIWNQSKMDELTKKYAPPASPPPPDVSNLVNEVTEVNPGLKEESSPLIEEF